MGVARSAVNECYSHAPDGREIIIQRVGDTWFVRCGLDFAQGRSLDDALIELLRARHKLLDRLRRLGHMTWVRDQAAAVESEIDR